jgi:hypothetical protein
MQRWAPRTEGEEPSVITQREQISFLAMPKRLIPTPEVSIEDYSEDDIQEQENFFLQLDQAIGNGDHEAAEGLEDSGASLDTVPKKDAESVDSFSGELEPSPVTVEKKDLLNEPVVPSPKKKKVLTGQEFSRKGDMGNVFGSRPSWEVARDLSRRPLSVEKLSPTKTETPKSASDDFLRRYIERTQPVSDAIKQGLDRILPAQEIRLADFDTKRRFRRLRGGFRNLRNALAGVGVSSARIGLFLPAGAVLVAASIPLSVLGFFMPIRFLRRGMHSGARAARKNGLSLLMNVARLIPEGRILPAAGVLATGAGNLAIAAGVAQGTHVLPALLVGPALLGGYVAGRGVIGVLFPYLPEYRTGEEWAKPNPRYQPQADPRNDEFERVAAQSFRRLGYRAEVIGTQGAAKSGHRGPGDDERDIILHDSSGSMAVVSCKRYNGKVGDDDVRVLYSSVIQHQADQGILVTTLGFTEGAKRIADIHNIKLVTIDELNETAENY